MNKPLRADLSFWRGEDESAGFVFVDAARPREPARLNRTGMPAGCLRKVLRAAAIPYASDTVATRILQRIGPAIERDSIALWYVSTVRTAK